jgi:hypothetical protein
MELVKQSGICCADKQTSYSHIQAHRIALDVKTATAHKLRHSHEPVTQPALHCHTQKNHTRLHE